MRSDWRSNNRRTYNKFNLLLWHDLISLSLSRLFLCHLQTSLSFDTKINHLFVLYIRCHWNLTHRFIRYLYYESFILFTVCAFSLQMRTYKLTHIRTRSTKSSRKNTNHEKKWKSTNKQTNKQLSRFSVYWVVYMFWTAVLRLCPMYVSYRTRRLFHIKIEAQTCG